MDGLDWLLERLPHYRRIDLRCEPDFYGASYHIADALKKPYPPRSHATWCHGWVNYKPIIYPRRIVHSGAECDTHLVHTTEQEKLLRKNGFRHIHVVGAPYLYAPELSVSRRAGSLLVMPRHSLPYMGYRPHERQYAEAIAALKPRFNKIVACVSGPCAEAGYWTKAFEEFGIDWIVGAVVDDRDAYVRMRTIFGSFEYVTTHAIGSHVAYAAVQGCKVSVYGPYSEQSRGEIASHPFYAAFPELMDANLRDGKELQVRERYPWLFVAPDEAVLKENWASRALGRQHVRKPEDLAHLLGWGPVRQFLGPWGGGVTPVRKKLTTLGRDLVRTDGQARRVYYRARSAVGRLARSTNETYWRLCRSLKGVPGLLPGEHVFPFGRIAYLDARTLERQFRDIFVNRCYECSCDSHKPVIVDCGSGIGLGVAWFKLHYPDANVTAFEANPQVRAILERNLQQLGMPDVTVRPDFVDAQAGNVTVDLSGFGCRFAVPGTHGCMVPRTRLVEQLPEEVDVLIIQAGSVTCRTLLDLMANRPARSVRRIVASIGLGEESRASLPRLLEKLTEEGYCYTLGRCEPIAQLHGKPEPTPFFIRPDAKCILRLYAWRESKTCDTGLEQTN